MPRFIKQKSEKIGAPPGTLIHIGEKTNEQVKINLVDYSSEKITERQVSAIGDVFPTKAPPVKTWINIDGIQDIDLIREIGKHFDIHPLTMEDIVNTGHRPKFEAFDDYVFIVLKMLSYDKENHRITSEQISILLTDHLLITFQEAEGDVFDTVRKRLRMAKGRMRNRGCDYLAYALIDSIVDQYFTILENVGDHIEVIEEELLDRPGSDTISRIHEIKSELIYMRKQIWPTRELVARVLKSDFDLLDESTAIFFNDVHDHTIQIVDTVESYRDLLSGMVDLYLSTVSHQMNKVMKVLTMIATIFIPITFIAGVYGMNFKHMPELDWRWGYPAACGLMGLIAVVLIIYFKKKEWL